MPRQSPSRQSPTERDFRGKRWLHIGLRTLHVIGVFLLGYAILRGISAATGAVLTLVSGLAMFALDLWSKPSHLVELAGLGVIGKLVLVGSIGLFPNWSIEIFWLVLIVSMVLSHAPGAFRHWSPSQRR